MEKSKIIATQMETSCNLNKDENERSVKEIKYRGIIGSLLYLTTSCPDIMFVVCLCACFRAP